ncbi:septin-1 [Tetranychus urticae]|uniref:Septin n=1 Tax=Tetranychus urticae TaxID=32264 RepID=T1L3Y6_TETUR|nr:septin-1 [Tetranychus urticae]
MPGVGSEIGFATLPHHLHRKYAKKGFDFTIMVVGESGLGKSTLINCLFLADLYKDRVNPPVEQLLNRTMVVEKKQLDIIEKGIKLKVTIVDTPGFADALNTENSFDAIEGFIDEQYDQYFKDESGLNRKNIIDNRVHCCLYFISPIGRGLSQLDIQFMKRIHQKVNLVPIIAKADAFKPAELHMFKKKVLKELDDHGISIFRIPECDSDEDEDFRRKDKEIKDSIPFAVVGSTTQIEINGRKTRGRVYPWGSIDIQDEQFSDYVKLKTFLSLHMQDLKDVTNEVLYENYRALYLTKLGSGSISPIPVRAATEATNTSIPADKLLQLKEEEIRRMQEQLIHMQEALRQQSHSVPASGNQSADSPSPSSPAHRDDSH